MNRFGHVSGHLSADKTHSQVYDNLQAQGRSQDFNSVALGLHRRRVLQHHRRILRHHAGFDASDSNCHRLTDLVHD
jgi:hypothetical protein